MARSPLRYPGGKTRAVKQIVPLILEEKPDTIVSPFLGGGSIELACEEAGIPVLGYDAFPPLVNFWHHMLTQPEELARRVRRIRATFNKDRFYRYQQREHTNDIASAVRFFALNRASYSGATLSGGYSPGHARFTTTSANRIAAFRTTQFVVEQASFEQSIAKHPDAFLFLDPPYMIQSNLYGKKGDHHSSFNHRGLADLVVDREQWIMTYNNCDAVRAHYSGHRIEEAQWAYGMNKSKRSSEVIIFSKDLS